MKLSRVFLLGFLLALPAMLVAQTVDFRRGVQVEQDGNSLIFRDPLYPDNATLEVDVSGGVGEVGLGDLDAGARAVIDGAVQIDSINKTGNDVTFASDGGSTTGIDLGIEGFAQEGNPDRAPRSKLPLDLREVPTGGSAGQVLMQQSGGSPHWANVPGAASSSPITTGQLVHDLGSYAGSDWLPYRAIDGGPPADAEENVNADWTAVSGDAQILNKPTVVTQSDVQDEIVSAARGLTSLSIDDADSIVVSDASARVGEPRRVWALSALDARVTTLAQAAGISLSSIEEYAKTGTKDRIPESRLPLAFEGLEDEFKKVGWLDDSSIRLFIGTTGGPAYTPSNITGLAYATRPQQGVRLENAWVAIRVSKDRDIGNLRVVEDDENDNPAPSSGWSSRIATNSDYDFYQNQFAAIEAGARLKGQQYNSLVLDETETIAVVRANNFWDDVQNKPPETNRELLNRDLAGVAVNSVTANSGVSRTNLQDTLDLDTEGHGLLAGSFTFGITGRSNTTIGFVSTPSGDNDLTTVRVSFNEALETIAGSPRYLATSNQFGIILVEANVFYGPDRYGVVVVRAARDENNVVGLNAAYLADAGTTARTANFNVTLSGVVVVEPTGIAKIPATGSGGTILDFETTLPSADGYADGQLAYIYGGTNNAAKGWYTKRSTTVHAAADTQLGGKVINPSSDLGTATAGAYTHQYFSRNAYAAARGGSIPANTTWADAPTDLESADFNYRTATRSDGELEFRFSTSRSYTGYLRVSAGPLTLDVGRLGSTTWRITGLTGAQVATLRENNWSISEPGQSGSVTTHRWVHFSGLP